MQGRPTVGFPRPSSLQVLGGWSLNLTFGAKGGTVNIGIVGGHIQDVRGLPM